MNPQDNRIRRARRLTVAWLGAATVWGTSIDGAGADERKFVVMPAYAPKAFVADGTPGLPPDGLYNLKTIRKDYFDRINPDIDSFAEYWEEISYGDVTITGDVFGWVTLPWALDPDAPHGGDRTSPADYIDLRVNNVNVCTPGDPGHIEHAVPAYFAYGAGEEFCDCTTLGDDTPEVTQGKCGALIIIDLVDDGEQQYSWPPATRGPGMPDLDAVGVNVWTPGERFLDLDGDLRWDGIDEKNDMMCHGADGCQNVCTGWVCVDEEFGFAFDYCTTDADCPAGSYCRRGSLFGAIPCRKYCSQPGPGEQAIPCGSNVDCLGYGTCMDPCPSPETCGDAGRCADRSGGCHSDEDCPAEIDCVKPGPRGCDLSGCGDLSMPGVDWNENNECDNEGGDDPRTPSGCTPFPYIPCACDEDCPFLEGSPESHVPCLVEYGVCNPREAVSCDDDRDCLSGACVEILEAARKLCDPLDLCIPPVPGLPPLPECCPPGLDPEGIQACRDEGRVLLCAHYPDFEGCDPRPEGVACGDPRPCCEFDDYDGDERVDVAEPFEDLIVRWEPAGHTPGSVWAPVSRDYIENNYPGDVPALLARTGNGYYNSPDLFTDHLNESGQPIGTKMMQDAGPRQFTYLVPKPGAYAPYVANAGEEPWFDSAWLDRYGSDPPAWPGGDVPAERNAPRVRAFDPQNPVPPGVTGATPGRRWFQANRGGWNGRGRGFLYDHNLQFDLGGDDWGFVILPEEEFGYYDGWVEHDDLPSSKYHREGDRRLGEVTSPTLDYVTLDGEDYPAVFGADLGAHNPQEPGPDGDNYGVAAGPGAVNIHGEMGYDAGDVCIAEWLTWRRDGASPTVGYEWSAANGEYHPYAGPASPITPAGACSVSGNACLHEADCPAGEDCYRPAGAVSFRDYNLDGMIDQGEARPELSENYSIDSNPFTPDNGTHSDYPFNRRRLIEDIVEALDPAVDWDDFVDRTVLPELGELVSGIALVPPESYTDVDRFPGAPDYHRIHTEDLTGVLFHDLVICQDCRDFPSAVAYAAHEYLHTWEGYPDLYDYDVFTEPGGSVVNCPIGLWDIMAGPRGYADLVHSLPPLKESSGWIEPVDLKSTLTPGVETTLTLPPAEFVRDHSYFYLENNEHPGERYWFWSAGNGFDRRFPGPGMLILKTDLGANPDPLPPQRRTAPFNYLIVQADGRGDLEACSTGGNPGDDGDVWPGSTGATTFDFDTVPPATWSMPNRWTGLDIRNIEPDGSGSVVLTLSWVPTNLPSLEFIDPPGGASVGSIYQVRFEATDVFGGTNIGLYYTTNEDDLTIHADDANCIGQRDKDSPGTNRLSMDWNIANLPDGEYFVFAKLIPGPGAGGTERSFTEPHPGRNNSGDGVLSILNVDISGDITSTARFESWTILCLDPGGQEWRVNSSLTQPEPSAPEEDPYPHAFTCPAGHPCEAYEYTSIGGEVTFVIQEGPRPFQLGDTFQFTTTGITEPSASVRIVEGQITANPLAVIDASPLAGFAPLTVYFDATRSYDPEGQPLEFHWDFGDGDTGVGPTLTHTFEAPRLFTVVLRATNVVSGRFGEAAVDIVVMNNSPHAVIRAAPLSGPAPLTVRFDGSPSSDIETPPDELVYQWDFGDGTTANDEGAPGILIQTEHVYTTQADGTPCTAESPCRFNAVLIVTDAGGKSDSAVVEILVGRTEVFGACCLGNGCLQNLEGMFCEVLLGGVFAGAGTNCADDVCVPGACCLPSGDCIECIEATCVRAGGAFQGPAISCAAVECPTPPGACCVFDICVPHQEQADCLSVDGEWAGPATECFADLCPLCDDGDADRDGDTDLYDFALFQNCLGAAGTGECKCVDMDNDGTVTLADFALFQRTFVGP